MPATSALVVFDRVSNTQGNQCSGWIWQEVEWVLDALPGKAVHSQHQHPRRVVNLSEFWGAASNCTILTSSFYILDRLAVMCWPLILRIIFGVVPVIGSLQQTATRSVDAHRERTLECIAVRRDSRETKSMTVLAFLMTLSFADSAFCFTDAWKRDVTACGGLCSYESLIGLSDDCGSGSCASSALVVESGRGASLVRRSHMSCSN